eukprot:4165569-Prymnesium_polylepis.1
MAAARASTSGRVSPQMMSRRLSSIAHSQSLTSDGRKEVRSADETRNACSGARRSRARGGASEHGTAGGRCTSAYTRGIGSTRRDEGSRGARYLRDALGADALLPLVEEPLA